ncbi:hypothetical protein [Rickettsia endosymbiont of Orchestes rusci]
MALKKCRMLFPRRRESRKNTKNKQTYIKIYYIIRLNTFLDSRL